MDTTPQDDQPVHTFFERYARALTDRDEKAIAGLYAVPSLILFPGQSVAVSDAAQTEQFFASSWGQYDGIDVATPQTEVIARTGHSFWVDVTWLHDGDPQERFVYQLVGAGDDWQIAVLTLRT